MKEAGEVSDSTCTNCGCEGYEGLTQRVGEGLRFCTPQCASAYDFQHPGIVREHYERVVEKAKTDGTMEKMEEIVTQVQNMKMD